MQQASKCRTRNTRGYLEANFNKMNQPRYTSPTIILDEHKCKKNIQLMAQKAMENKVIFRPHFKTHQSAEIGQWFRDAGVLRITVSSVKMAAYFAANGWEDVLIAFPVNLPEINKINELASAIKLALLVESEISISFLEKHLEHPIDIYLKIDTGYHRCGILSAKEEEIEKLLRILARSKKMQFKGFLTHAGHTYKAGNPDEICKIHHDTIDQLIALKKKFSKIFPGAIISTGDTPSCSIATDFSGVDEIRPGNFVFYDVMQLQLGVCKPADIAVTVYCPVVATYKTENKVVIYGGSIHLSNDFIQGKNGQRLYGLVANPGNDGWSDPLENTVVSNVTQEHGLIFTDEKHFNDFRIGELTAILPAHSCLAANLASHYYTTDGRTILKMIR
jgi:D-serine deaminase-like pyridoxal phosphate-dependent protein